MNYWPFKIDEISKPMKINKPESHLLCVVDLANFQYNFVSKIKVECLFINE